MYTIFILFFASLLGIIIMIGRKLAPIRNGQIVLPKHSHPFVPDLEKMKNLTSESTKKYGYLALVSMLRFYVRSSNTLQLKYEKLQTKIKSMQKKNKDGDIEEVKEANKFLKMITEYKHKIRNIKTKITEEEVK